MNAVLSISEGSDNGSTNAQLETQSLSGLVQGNRDVVDFDFVTAATLLNTMDNLKEFSSALNTVNDKKPESTSTTGKSPSHPKTKRNIMLEKFQKFEINGKLSLGQ